MITELTHQQERQLENTIQYWLKVGRNCERLNRGKVSTIIRKLYKEVGEKEPEVRFFSSPQACINKIQSKDIWGSQSWNQLDNELWNQLQNQLENGFRDKLWNQFWNRLESQFDNLLQGRLGNHLYWVYNTRYMSSRMALYNFCRQIGVRYTNEQNRLLDLWLEATKECFWWSVHKDVVPVSERPTNLKLDERGKFHSTDDMAMKFEDGYGIYAVHGIRVDEKVIRREYTISEIENEPNVEVRRVMMDLYGQSRYLQESNAETVHQDDWGVLYRKVMSDDEHLMMVKVVNSTPEPDGSFKDYFIRVEPSAYGGLKTARAAVASTWRRKNGSLAFERPEDYYPIYET